MTEAARLEKLFERYKFIAPVPAPVRKSLAGSRSRILKSTLKELGTYSIWYGLILFILLRFRRIGIKFSISAAKIVAVAACVVVSGLIISGAYFALRYYQSYSGSTLIENKTETGESANPVVIDNGASIGKDEARKKPAAGIERKNNNAPVSEIFLYNGKMYRGVIQSRGNSYIISTSDGQVSIPGNQVKMIKRAKE